MRPIIKRNLWQRRWALVWWSLGLVAFISLELGVYSSIKSQATQLNQALAKLPSSFKSLFGANTDLFSPIGYLNSRLFYFLLPLLLSVLAIGWGSSLLAREESDGTLELLLSRPVRRGKLVVAKVTTGLTISLIVTSIAVLTTMIWVKAVGLAVPLPYVAFAGLVSALLSIAFGALAFFIAATGRAGRGLAIGIASIVGLGSYIIASLESNVHWLLWPSRFLPYHYYNPTEILNGHYTWWPAAAFSLSALLLFIFAWLAFRRRDTGV